MAVTRGKASIRLEKGDLKDLMAPLRRVGVRFSQLVTNVLGDTATFWHHQIMPEHFTPGAETRYGYEPRHPGYIKNKRARGVGQGKFVSNLLTGRSLRTMSSLYEVSSRAKSATVSMRVPAYFRRPFIGRINLPIDGSAAGERVITISRQPDKPREIVRVNERDFQRMNKYASLRLRELALAHLRSGISKAA